MPGLGGRDLEVRRGVVLGVCGVVGVGRSGGGVLPSIPVVRIPIPRIVALYRVGHNACGVFVDDPRLVRAVDRDHVLPEGSELNVLAGRQGMSRARRIGSRDERGAGAVAELHSAAGIHREYGVPRPHQLRADGPLDHAPRDTGKYASPTPLVQPAAIETVLGLQKLVVLHALRRNVRAKETTAEVAQAEQAALGHQSSAVV